ncbi:leucyl aminopeptidase family protein [Flexibacterium corallicola]|uniref:leucyl aminopeptidase family protein n=1 Tax=Flexibacterium corallicola TaxID=3037259 RepID=UPI00286F1338|nr:leucyl aminopeptidase family protein [Pseudovibrio sp. M1P-2-3]
MFNSLLPFDDKAKPYFLQIVESDNCVELLNNLGQLASGLANAQGFVAEHGTCFLVPSADGTIARVLLGAGENFDNLMHLGAAAAKSLPKGAYILEGQDENEAEFALGFALASYRYSDYSKQKACNAQLMVKSQSVLEALSPVISGVQVARDLINTPANDMGPEELAKAATDAFEKKGGTVKIIMAEELENGFPLIHAVGKGSDRAPRLIDAAWGDVDAPKITLVGKGVVFDTGGLDLKPASGMLLMKKDMGGAANVLGLATMVMEAQLPVRLRVLIPAVENSVSGNSFRPSDVFKSRKGLTVEIGNTDAEGRLVLADALTFADEEKPELLIDMATLTGAARVALGPDLPPFYTDDEELAETVSVHSEAVSDPLWRMPLWKPYEKYITSKIADIANINTSGAGFAGSITAGLFLKRFVENTSSWAHFDIYGWTPIEKDVRTYGGEAHGIRALFDMLSANYK